MALPQYQGNQGDPLRNIENRFLTIINSGFQQYDLTLDQNTQASFLKLAARGATSLVQRISIEGTDPRKQRCMSFMAILLMEFRNERKY